MVAAGASQGGGLSLAVAGLEPRLAAALPDVPFLCHYRRSTQITEEDPYQEIARYCQVHRDQVERVFDTLSYFDGLNFAACAQAPALFSVGLMDEVCPPSTVFAAYNHYAGPKQIQVYEFNHHEGGQSYQVQAQIRISKRIMGLVGVIHELPLLDHIQTLGVQSLWACRSPKKLSFQPLKGKKAIGAATPMLPAERVDRSASPQENAHLTR